MNNNRVIGDFIKQNVINQNPSSGSKIGLIFTIICGLIFIGLIIYFFVAPSKKLNIDQNKTTGGKSAEARINLGLEVYKNYFKMNQLQIPE